MPCLFLDVFKPSVLPHGYIQAPYKDSQELLREYIQVLQKVKGKMKLKGKFIQL